MANRLSMAQINAIVTLHASEHSNREIGRLLGVHRETVGTWRPPRRPKTGQTRPPAQRRGIRRTDPCSIRQHRT